MLKLSQVRAQAILAILESRREEAYHIENDGTLSVGYEFKLRKKLFQTNNIEACSYLEQAFFVYISF